MKIIKLLTFICLTSSVIAQVNNNRASTGTFRLSAFKNHETLNKTSPYKDLKWRYVGPDNISGRCTDIWGIEGNKNIIYASFATGGFWKTEDAGKTWQSFFDKEATQSIGNFAISKSNPNIIYLGTGEANIFRASLPGIGMFKSTDAGKTWQHIGLTNTSTIARVVIHPSNPNIVYVATSGNEWSYNPERGVYKTIDGGKTWQKLNLNSDFQGKAVGCIDLIMDTSDPNTLYASTWNRIRKRWSDPTPEDGDYIFKTTDGGKTWKKLTNGLPPTEKTGRIGIALCATKPNVIYAYVDNHNEKRQGKEGELDSYGRPKELVIMGAEVYKSTDKGESWTKMSENDKQMETFGGTYGWVFSQIRVDPNNENRIYIMGLSIGYSDDSGKTWQTFKGGEVRIHGDNHGMWIDPSDSNYILNANDGGAIVTYDGGKTWKNFFNEIPTTQFYNVSYDMAKPYNIYGSVQDEGTFSGSSQWKPWQKNPENLKKWDYAPGGEGTIIAIDSTDENIVYSSSFYGRLERTDLRLPRKERATKIFPKKADDEDPHRGEWLAYTLLSPHDTKTLYHGFQYVFKTTDRGDTWKRISPDLTYNNKDRMGKLPYAIAHQAITAMSESPMKKGVLYAGTDDGRVHVTLNDGGSWTEISNGLPFNAHTSRLEASKYAEGTVYVSLSDRREDNSTPYVFKSTDFGKTWISIAGNLPHAPVNVIREDPRNKNVLYCGTDLGIYVSKNGGKTWDSIQADLPATVSVQDLFVHPRDNNMIIATYGRGVYALDNLSKLQN